MNHPPTPAQVQRFARAVESLLALAGDGPQAVRLGEVLARRAAACGGSVPGYLDWLEAAGGGADETVALAQELTIAETGFFRHVEQFRAFAERACAAPAGRPLRVLSAGCATGEEAWSIAMTLHEVLGPPALRWSVRAVDASAAAIAHARRACYGRWSLREMPEAAQRRWLREEGGAWVPVDELRGAVAFSTANLALDDAALWAPGSWDIVFCRNVMMYFTRQASIALLERIARGLVPGGALFLSHAESLRGLSDAFALRESHGAFFQERLAEPAAEPAAEADWSVAIRDSAERVRALEVPASEPAPACAALDDARRLLREERFADARAAVLALPGAIADMPDALLLHAMLLAHGGEFGPAEQLCHRLLELDAGDAAACHLLALCREGVGDARGAVDADRRALVLDPSFAMPRLHLGLLARRAGDRTAMRRELGRALERLEGEDEGRLLLFGGGFGREALQAMCRAHLQAAEQDA